jgi:peroxiredoxin
MSNKKILLLALVLFILTIVFHFHSKKQPTGEESEKIFDFLNRPIQWQGRYAPDFEIELMNGEKFRLSDHVGKQVIILNFFSTWCGPCKDEMPEFNAFYAKHKDDPFILIGINAGENSDTVRAFMKEFGIGFPLGIDNGDKIQTLYTVRSFPTTIFIGADGIVRNYEIGQIMNADIAFDTMYKMSMEIIKSGKGIAREAYLKNLSQQKDLNHANKEKDNQDRLEGRAKVIAETMYCPCGCSDRVIDCNCKTAKDIRKKLTTSNLSGKTDEEIIKDLNKEFCVRGEKDGHGKG